MSARVTIRVRNETNGSVSLADILVFQAPIDFKKPNIKSAVLAKLPLQISGMNLDLSLPYDFALGVLYKTSNNLSIMKSTQYQALQGDIWEFSDTTSTLSKLNTTGNTNITVRNSAQSKNPIDAAIYKNELLVTETTGISPGNQSEINLDNNSIYLVVQQGSVFKVGDTFDTISMISKATRFNLENQLTIRAFTDPTNQMVKFALESAPLRNVASSTIVPPFNPAQMGTSFSQNATSFVTPSGQSEFQMFQNYRMFKEFQMFQMFKEFQEFQAYAHSKQGNQQ
jgi:hypothetical protein